MSSGSGSRFPPDPIPFVERNNLVALLLRIMELNASDLHLSVGYPPMMRLHGVVTPTTLPELSSDDLHQMLYDVLDDDQRKRLERDKELDFALQIGATGRFRVNCFYNMKGEGAVFRGIPSVIKSFDELGLPAVLRKVCERPRGIALVTGPTGSGKSTTLAAMVDHINSTRDSHILTIEDPIEFIHKPKRGIVNQRELGPNTHSFAAALRSALREDPDVILVGELRDLETISLAITAAETGHLVFGTLHTQSAPKTVDRVVDVFPPEQQKLIRMMFAESFQAIVCQTLLRRKDGKGRIAALEIMLGTAATRSLIREGKTHQLSSIIQTSQRVGMQALDQVLKDLMMRGLVTEQEAIEKANNPDFIRPGASDALESERMSVSHPSHAAPSFPGPSVAPVASTSQGAPNLGWLKGKMPVPLRASGLAKPAPAEPAGPVSQPMPIKPVPLKPAPPPSAVPPASPAEEKHPRERVAIEPGADKTQIIRPAMRPGVAVPGAPLPGGQSGSPGWLTPGQGAGGGWPKK